MKPQCVRYNCAVDSAMAVIEGRWKCTILCMLTKDGQLRFSELQKRIGEITSRILSKQLKELESDGMVERSVSAEGKVRVEYSITEKGLSIIPILEALGKWGVEHQCIQVIVPSLDHMSVEHLSEKESSNASELAEMESMSDPVREPSF